MAQATDNSGALALRRTKIVYVFPVKAGRHKVVFADETTGSYAHKALLDGFKTDGVYCLGVMDPPFDMPARP